MKVWLVARVLSLVSFVVSVCMSLPMVWSVMDGSDDLWAFAASIVCGVTVSVVMFVLSGGGLGSMKRGDYKELGIREAFAVVGLSWVVASLVGGLPYLFSGTLNSLADAFFETASGFTTTGATVINDVEIVPRGILFWRGMTHWLGGMGIIVLSLAVLPFLGVGGMELYKVEVPGPTPDKITPRLQQTAMLLWVVYLFLTCAETVMLMFGGMDFFDAVVHTFATVATGGFSTKNASIAYYQSPYIEWVITFFMFASGANFSLHFMALTGLWRKALEDEEFWLYVKLVVSVSLIIAITLFAGNFGMGLWRSLRASAFQLVSFMTTTGFVSENYTLWPFFVQFILLLMAFIGGCAGSTGGGLKVVRTLVMWRSIGMELLGKLHPSAVLRARVNGKVISPKAINDVMTFFTLYVIITVGSTLAVIAIGGDKINAVTAASGVVTCISNAGPGLGGLGFPATYFWLPAGVKWILSFCMLAGRLELYAVILLFAPSTWRR